jgi:carbohydrate-selective porin OprB
MVGDARLNLAPECGVEDYYAYKALKLLTLTGKAQYIKNPGYKSDRGPPPAFAVRVHSEI